MHVCMSVIVPIYRVYIGLHVVAVLVGACMCVRSCKSIGYMCVHVCMCVCVCVYVCMYICMYVCMYVCVYVCRPPMFVYVCNCMYLLLKSM